MRRPPVAQRHSQERRWALGLSKTEEDRAAWYALGDAYLCSTVDSCGLMIESVSSNLVDGCVAGEVPPFFFPAKTLRRGEGRAFGGLSHVH